MSGLLRSAVSYLSGSDADEFVGATVDLESHQLSIKHVIGDGRFYSLSGLKKSLFKVFRKFCC